MKHLSIAITMAALLVIGHQASAQMTLFDGGSLDDWTISGDANWSLVDGAVEATNGGGYLISENSYSDFVLTLEFWVDEPANSGVFIRCADRNAIAADTCYEVNIYDQREDQTYRTGGIVDFAAPMAKIDAGGQWNTYEIRANGTRLLVMMNGIVTIDIEDSSFSEGPFALQYGSGVVKFRNVQIQPL
jgi:hypothetical protein